MDVETLRASVQKTGRLVIVDEAPATCSAAAEIAALIVEDPDTFRALKAPVRRVCAMPVPVPYSPPLEQAALPSRDDIKGGRPRRPEGVRMTHVRFGPFAPLLVLVSALLLVAEAGAFQLFRTDEATIADIQAALKARTLTCRALVQMYLDRIEAYDKKGPALTRS